MNFFKSISILLFPCWMAWACTDLAITSKDGAWINGRSMEFALPMQTKISLHPKGISHQSKAPGGEKGVSWTSKYGYVSMDCLEEGFTVDGMNEQGLSMGALWFPGVEYPQPKTSTAHCIVLQDLGPWILGNFSTVDEVKAALPSLNVWAEAIEPIGIPPLHLTIHDKNGHHLVVEFVDGHMNILDNPMAVLTNAPRFEWHLTNLRNYINLSALNAPPMNLHGTHVQQLGQGTGLLGLPGDWTPPSRFVKAALLTAFAAQPGTAQAAVNLAEHLLNTFDIPIGTVRGSSDPSSFELTQWVVIKDLKNKLFYYRTYEDLTLRSIDLKRLDLSAGRPEQSVPLEASFQPVDMTSSLFKN